MPLSLDDYHTKLLTKILFAASQDEVKEFIDAAVKSYEQNNISRFADKILLELNLFTPMDKDAQQWSNIRMAKILFNRILRQLNEPSQ